MHMRVCVVLCSLSAPARERVGEPPPRAGGGAADHDVRARRVRTVFTLRQERAHAGSRAGPVRSQ